MDARTLQKTVKTYTKMYGDTWKKRGSKDFRTKENAYAHRPTEMLNSTQFETYDIYPTIDMKKVYAVMAMCLQLREETLSQDAVFDFIHFTFRKPKRMFKILETCIDCLPNAYHIAEKWNLQDHANRVKDGSITYESFTCKEGKIEYNITKCMYVEIFAAYGIRSDCKIFCMSDTQAYANLTKHVSFTRYSDLSDGQSCHDVICRIKVSIRAIHAD